MRNSGRTPSGERERFITAGIASPAAYTPDARLPEPARWQPSRVCSRTSRNGIDVHFRWPVPCALRLNARLCGGDPREAEGATRAGARLLPNSHSVLVSDYDRLLDGSPLSRHDNTTDACPRVAFALSGSGGRSRCQQQRDHDGHEGGFHDDLQGKRHTGS
jgi:hypothetical protein